MKSGSACADHRSAKRSSPRIARLLLLLSELVSCSSFDYQDVKLTKIVKFAIGWPLEDVAEENRARGSTPDALLDVGYQSLGYVEVSVGGGHLWPHGPYERTLYDASRAEGEIFCTQARHRASREGLRTFAMAVLIIRNETQCEEKVSALVSQRLNVLELSRTFLTVPVSVGISKSILNFITVSSQDIGSAARYFCHAHAITESNCALELEWRASTELSLMSSTNSWMENGEYDASFDATVENVEGNQLYAVRANFSIVEHGVSRRYRVFFWPVEEDRWGRLRVTTQYMMIFQGFREHPAVDIVGTHEEAEWVVYVLPELIDITLRSPFSPSMRSILPVSFYRKVVVFDLGDSVSYEHDSFLDVCSTRRPTHLMPGVDDGAHYSGQNCALYFKRSWVNRHNGTSRPFLGDNGSIAAPHPSWYRPIHFALLDRYQMGTYLPHAERPLTMSCLLRSHSLIHFDESRARVLHWVMQAAQDWGLADRSAFVGHISDAIRTEHDIAYYQALRHTRVVITANPSYNEGDHRTWEALGSGALVFVDRTMTPLAPPLIDGIHVVEYDTHDLEDFRARLKYYIFDAPEEAETIAKQGTAFALRHHRPINRASYVLGELESRRQVEMSFN